MGELSSRIHTLLMRCQLQKCSSLQLSLMKNASNHVYYLGLITGSLMVTGVSPDALAQSANRNTSEGTEISLTTSNIILEKTQEAISPILLSPDVSPSFSPSKEVLTTQTSDGILTEDLATPESSTELSVSDEALTTQAYDEISVEDLATPALSTETSESDTGETNAISQISNDSVEIAVPTISSEITSSRVEILTPIAETVLDVPATTVILRFPIGSELDLLVNGEAVNNDLIGRTETDTESGLITQSWYGVSLDKSENIISVTAAGGGPELTSIPVAVRGTPESIEVGVRESSIPADGRSVATVQGRLLDEAGNISNWTSIVTLTASDGQFIGADYNPDQAGFQVQAQNGIFTAELQSPLEAKMVQLQAKTSGGLEAFNRVQFVTSRRPSIATGVVDLRFGARGTDYHSSFRDFLPLDEDNGYELDFSAAMFATGNIGEWLFTGAFNSDRALNEDCRGESGVFSNAADSCNSLYPVYGDDSSRTAIAPSQDRLYLRLERNSSVEGATPDYAMWGDFNTQEFSNQSQLFTGLNRQLHGFKFNYNLGNLAATGFYGNNIEGFQRDTIAPDGTSGLYFTSRRLIIPGSEVVVIELEELDRPGTVIERQQLFQGTDYDIDYDRGTILFNDSIPQTAMGEFGEILIRRIVATYQYENQGDDTNIVAGRLQYNFDRSLNSSSWLGATYVNENQGNRNFQLYGADALISLGDSGQLLAEYAHSDNDFELSGPISGSAYRVEIDGDVSDWLSGRAYWRSTDSGFSNSATTSFVPGQTRYGAQADISLGPDTTLKAQFDHEDNNGVAPRPLTTLTDLVSPGSSPIAGRQVDNSLTTYSLGFAQRIGETTDLEFDWIHRERTDRLSPDTLSASSDQLRSRITHRLTDQLTFRAQNDLTLSSESDPLYPSRTLFGLDWEFMPGLSVGVNQIFYGGGRNGRDSLTTIDFKGEQQLGPDTTIRGRFSSIDGQRLGGAIGLEQGFNLGPGLRLDLGYERAFNSVNGGTTAASDIFSQPFAVGTGGSGVSTSDANTYTVGLSYTDNPDLQANARFEHRTSSQGSNTVFEANTIGRLSPALSALFTYQYADTANQNLRNLGATSNLKLGLAYRDPNEDKFNALVRYEHRINPGSIPTNATFGSSIDTAEHVFSTEAIYTPNWQWELYGKYAFRNSSTTINRPADVGGDFTSSNNLHLAQFRATYRFDYHWDFTGEVRWIGGLGDYNETGYSLEMGYYPTPDLRMYAGYSGGGAQDRDFGVNRSAGGLYMGVTAKINSLFDGFGLQDIAPAQQQESHLQPTDAEPETVSPSPEELDEMSDGIENAEPLDEEFDGTENPELLYDINASD